MSYTALNLISDAYSLSQVVTSDYEEIGGGQFAKGLLLLNAILAEKAANNRLIPYYNTYTFNTIALQEAYTITNLITIELLNFTYVLNNSVRYVSDRKTRREYFEIVRANNVATLPFTWRFERQLNGGTLYLYPLPSTVFSMTAWGKYGLTSVNFNDDISTIYDNYYIQYLRYALARDICNETGVVFQAEERFREIQNDILDISTPDLKIRKLTSFSSSPALNWAIINLGQGTIPS